MPVSVYCLYCFVGKEHLVENAIAEVGYSVIRTVAIRTVIKENSEKQERRPLLPGYVFFSSEEEPAWAVLLKARYVIRVLQYSNGTRALYGKDLNFIQWVLRYNGVITVSRVMEVGTKIRVISGPLKDYEGSIIKINKRQRSVAVRIDSEQVAWTVWLSYDYIREQ